MTHTPKDHTSEIEEILAGVFMHSVKVMAAQSADWNPNLVKEATQAIQKVISDEVVRATEKVTRFEVIDHTYYGTGRIVTEYDVNVELDFQDDGKTLKVFLTDRELTK